MFISSLDCGCLVGAVASNSSKTLEVENNEKGFWTSKKMIVSVDSDSDAARCVAITENERKNRK